MKNEQYHIDVTPEEDALFRDLETQESTPNKPKFTKVFWVVLGVHVAVVGAIITTCSAMGSRSSSINLEQPVAEIPETLQQEKLVSPEQQLQTAASATPSPSSTSKQESVVAKTSSSRVEKDVSRAAKQPVVTTQQPKLIKEYIVKKGDTIVSISKKYKLSTKRLVEINKIKDPNNIKVGQVLKFM